MIKTSRQLKDLIRNLSKEKAADAQLLMRNYMMERYSMKWQQTCICKSYGRIIQRSLTMPRIFYGKM